MSFKKFLISKIFIKNLALAMAIGVGLIMILLIWLNIYTRHGQARPVPDFYGLTLDEAGKLAKKSKLRYLVLDSVFTTVVPRGCIVEQNPKPGFKVKKTRRIALTINAFNPEMVGVPNLIGLSKKQALVQIQSSGLEIGKLNYKSDLSVDFVLDQLHNGKQIAQGDSIQKGSVIDLVLGKGLSNQRTLVPNLIGLNLESARNKILSASFNLGTYIYDASSILSARDTLDALVYKQSPDYEEDASYQLGSAIYLWLTVDSTKFPVDSTLLILSDTIPLTSIIPGVVNTNK
jgi:eukaryotic-like serine/threonine-protein kinase